MKNLGTIFQFELKGYLKNKFYLLSTGLIMILLILALSLPEMFLKDRVEPLTGGEKECYAIVDSLHYINDLTVFENKLPFSKIVVLSSKDELKEGVKEGKYKAGIVVNSLTNIDYIVENTHIGDMDEEGFKEAVSDVYREKKLKETGIEYKKIKNIYDKEITTNRIILGKDGAHNYVYTYILAFVIYVMVILYGQNIAVALTTEKSDRTMEILITSTDINVLMAGKILAAACASFIQGFAIIGTGIFTYYNKIDLWAHKLDFIFNIPLSVLVVFALFGVMGFIFYAFIFGAMGMVASRVEEVGRSISGITLIFVLVFFIGIYGMAHSDGLLIKAASFIPFSSCIAVMIRVAMGNISFLEMDVSMVILLTSIIIAGVCSARICQMEAIEYEKRIPIRTVLKNLKLKR